MCVTDGSERQVKCFLCTVFESDSEYVRLLVIQTPHSYKLNTIILRTFTWQNRVVTEVVEMTRRLRTMESDMSVSVVKPESKIVAKAKKFDEFLLNVVDETLREVFREEGTKAIYIFMENKCNLRRKEFAEKPEDFSASLDRLLSSAAPMIETMILKNLYSKLQVEYEENEGYRFSEFLYYW